MAYAFIENGAVAVYPITYLQFRKRFPGTSFPKEPNSNNAGMLAEFGLVPVANTVRPTEDPATQNVLEGLPAFSNGKWRQVWSIVPASAEEIAARQKSVADKAARDEAKNDAFVQEFIAMSQAQLSARIDADVTNLASVKVLLKRYGVMLLILAKREFGSAG